MLYMFPFSLCQNGTCPQCAPDVDFAEISLQCNNFSGADCDQLVYLASKEAIREVIHGSQDISSADNSDKEPKTRLVAKRHFSAALKKIKPSIKPEVNVFPAFAFCIDNVRYTVRGKMRSCRAYL